MTLQVRFDLQDAAEREVIGRVQSLLNLTPDEWLPPQGEGSAWGRVWNLFYDDTRSLPLDAVLERLPEHLKTVFQGTIKGQTEPGMESSPRRRGPKPDMESHRKVEQIVSRYGPDWQDKAVLEKVCRAFDQKKIPPSES